MYREAILLLVHLVTHIDAQFTNSPPDKENRCSGGTSSVYFNWTYATSASVLIVEWKKDGSAIAQEPIGLSQPFNPLGSYVGRLTKILNAQVSLGSLSIADSGIYTCEVTYTSGSAYISNSVSLSVYDILNNETRIQMTPGDGMVTLSPMFFDSSITYTWKSQNNVIYVGSPFVVKKNDNYTLCVSGGKADCLNPALSPCASIVVTGLDGLTTPASTDSADMSTTISEATSPPVNTSSSGLSQEIVITIIISSIFAAGGLVLLIVLVVRQCKQKNTGILAKNKEHHFPNKEGKLTKKEYLKSNKSRKSLYSEKRNIKQGSSSLDKKRNAQFENSVPKDRIYRHYPQTIDCWNKCENQHVFKNSYTEGNMMLHRNWPDNCPKPYSRPNGRMPYQSHNSEHPGHSEGMFQYYRADNVYRGQQMNHQMQYVALKDMHINNKSDSTRSSDRRPYERNWDMLY